MRKLVHAEPDPLALALVDTVVAARWEASELLSRRSSPVTADLLRGHAAELAHSSFARDQMLRLALEAAALDLEKGRSPLELGALFFFSRDVPSAQEREALRRLVAALGDPPADASDHLAPEFERRLAPELLTDAELCTRLLEEAELHETLWDDPRLAAEPQVRLRMLRSAEGFRERAAELNPSRVLAARRADRRRRSLNPQRRPKGKVRDRVQDLALRMWRRLSRPLNGPLERSDARA
jgi:hypothetical protein